MPAIKSWLLAARLRTLPLSVSGILTGTAMALRKDAFDPYIMILALFTTIGFQVLSNFANDYGDGVKGTDNQDRVGPARAMQMGLLTSKDLIRGMAWVVFFTLLFVVALVYSAFGGENLLLTIVFLLLGIVSLIAAVKYTVGKSAYGYRGLGDVFVFLFFGLLGVVGCYFLFTHAIQWYDFFPGMTIGFLATMVLHLNNMRDRLEDKKVGKRTLAVILGKKRAVLYHSILLFFGLCSWGAYLYFSTAEPLIYLTLIFFIPFFLHWIKVLKTESHEKLDPELKKVALSTFVMSLVFLILTIIG